MPRNINILKNKTMRPGMAMIMAIGFLVIIAGMMATMLNMTATTTKRTAHIFMQEQAQLLAMSATEFALLAISGHNRVDPANPLNLNDDCITSTRSQYPPGAATSYFTIVTNIQYIGLTNATGQCAANSLILGNFAPESAGTILIDTYVTSNEAFLNLGQQIRYHRRILQKP